VTGSLRQIAALVHRETGMVLPPAREPALRAAVSRAGAGLDADAFLAALSDPARRREFLTRLIDEVTIRETAFARDRAQLDAIGWPGLLSSAWADGSATIRVWSAACASGEEPYSLALLADQAFWPVLPPVDVLGTDISAAALAAAAAGRYRDRAVGMLAAPERSRYLERGTDGSHVVGRRLRGLVRFRQHNLAHGPFPPAGETGFDLIVCRNVLIYFEQPLAARVVDLLRRSLRPGGVLVLGAADRLQLTTLPAPPGPVVSGQPAPPGPVLSDPPAPPRPVPPAPVPPGPVLPGPLAPPGPVQPAPALRRPLGREPALLRGQQIEQALAAAGCGDRGTALEKVSSLLASDPLDAEAHFIHGLVLLESGEPAAAVAALRRALYADTGFALAAFTLGRAFDALGEPVPARRAYERALRAPGPASGQYELTLRQVGVRDIAAACRAQLSGRTTRLPTAPASRRPPHPDIASCNVLMTIGSQ
jgi:chemotaxis protein methyltransferase CheR